MSVKSKIVFSVLLTFTLTCAFFTGVFHNYGIRVGESRLDRLEAVADIIDRSYIGDFDREKAENAAIDAYVAEIGDPYSVFYDRENADALMSAVEGSYVGIGVEIYADPETKEIVVIAAYYGGPARNAGIKSGDVILAIDGKEYNSETMADAVTYMKGHNMESPVGTELTLTVRRGEELIEVPVKREEVEIYTASEKTVGGNLRNVCYIGFTEEAAQELGERIKGSEGADGIILDLRENPGGDLGAAVEVCDMFLDDGLIMYTEDKNGNKNSMYAEEGASELPLAVLVDGGSASASEIVAGCLQARGRAVIIGEKTYGKGVSQMVFALGENRDELVKITGYKNYRPDGIWLNEAVTPDIEAANNPSVDEYGEIIFDSEGDLPLEKAIEYLNDMKGKQK